MLDILNVSYRYEIFKSLSIKMKILMHEGLPTIYPHINAHI